MSCNNISNTTGCSNNLNCQNRVCEIDNYCCSIKWDNICVVYAKTYCKFIDLPEINNSEFNTRLEPVNTTTLMPPLNPSSIPPLNPSSMPPLNPSSIPPLNPSSMPPLNPSSMPPLNPSSMPPLNASSNLIPPLNITFNETLIPSLNNTLNDTLTPIPTLYNNSLYTSTYNKTKMPNNEESFAISYKFKYLSLIGLILISNLIINI
jgi:hypothetical protein